MFESFLFLVALIKQFFFCMIRVYDYYEFFCMNSLSTTSEGKEVLRNKCQWKIVD